MSDERSDLILNMLRAIRAEQAVQREKLDEIISRLGRLEREVADLHRETSPPTASCCSNSKAADSALRLARLTIGELAWNKAPVFAGDRHPKAPGTGGPIWDMRFAWGYRSSCAHPHIVGAGFAASHVANYHED